MLTSMALLAGLAACEQEPGDVNQKPDNGDNNDKPTTAVVVLNADKDSIKADGTDTVTFEVTVDGKVRTAECQIICLNDNSTIEDAKFSTTEADTYEFKAAFGDVLSETKSIVATAVSDDPENPGNDDPENPGNDDPENPGNDDPENPGNDDPENPGNDDPENPGNDDPENPGNDDPEQPVDKPSKGDYTVGDVIECAGSKGVVYAFKDFPIWNDDYTEIVDYDTYCYVFSLDEEDLQWSTENVWCNCGTQRGDWNTQDMLNNGTSPDKYPAAQWCIAHGEGWFMPSSMELNLMWDAITNGARDFNAPSVAEFNKIITDNGGEPSVSTYYWSSNETSEDMIELVAFMDDSVICLEPYKSNKYTVRAAYRFIVE